MLAEYPKDERVRRALLSTAMLLEYEHRFPEAAITVERLIKLFPRHDVVPRLGYLLAEFHEKGGDTPRAEKAYRRFIKKHGGDPGLAVTVMRAHLALGKSADADGRRKRAREHLEEVVKLYGLYGLEPGPVPAASGRKGRCRPWTNIRKTESGSQLKRKWSSLPAPTRSRKPWAPIPLTC